MLPSSLPNPAIIFSFATSIATMSLLAPTNIAASNALVSLSIGTARYDIFLAMGTTSFAPILVGISRRPHACYRRLRS